MAQARVEDSAVLHEMAKRCAKREALRGSYDEGYRAGRASAGAAAAAGTPLRQLRGLELAVTFGAVAQFVTVVPPSWLAGAGDELVIVCPCGAHTLLELPAITVCAGDCGRWFLRHGETDVRVAKWPTSAEVELAEREELGEAMAA